MKKFISFLIILCPVCSNVAMSQSSDNNLVGTWKLISTVGHMSNGSWNNDSSEIYQIKVITPGRFMFTTYSVKNDSLLMSAQGSIKVTGNKYIERIDKSTMKEMVGETYTYNSTLKGSRWHIDGGLKETKLVEDWIKIN